MSSLCENLKWSVRRLTSNKTIEAAVDEIFKAIEEENRAKCNYEAFIRVGDVEEKNEDLPDSGYGEDWEVLTGALKYEDEDGTWQHIDLHINSFEEKREELVESYQDRIDEIDDAIGDIEEEMDDLEECIDSAEDEINELEDDEEDVTPDIEDKKAEIAQWRSDMDGLGTKMTELEKKKDELEDVVHNLKRADFEPDEIYWNTLYQYNGMVDEDAAIECGLAVVRVGDDEYLGLCGCGMDLSPKFFCYQALVHGYVDRHWSDKISRLGPDYFKSVVGKDVFERATKELGISEFMDATQEDLNKRMKEFDEKMDQISSAIRDGSLDKDLGALAAISLLVKVK